MKATKSEAELTNNFSNNLNRLISDSGKQQVDVARDLKILPTTLNNWCTGKALPRMGSIQLLADYFHVKKTDLIEEYKPEPQAQPQLTKEESELLSLLRAVPPEEQEKVLMAVEVALRSKGLL